MMTANQRNSTDMTQPPAATPKPKMGTRDVTPNPNPRRLSIPMSPGGVSTFSSRAERDATFSEFIFDRLAVARDFDAEWELAIHSPARTG